MIDSGLARRSFHWPRDFRKARADVDLSWIAPVRSAAVLLSHDGLRAHDAGRDARAVARLGDLLRLSRALDGYPEVVVHLVAGGIREMAADMAIDLSYDLSLGGPNGADRDAVTVLIAAMLDDEPSRAGLIVALRGERKNHLLAIAEFGAKALPGVGRSMSSIAVRPFTMTEADLTVRLDTAWIEALRKSSDLPTAAGDPDVTAISSEIHQSRVSVLAESLTEWLSHPVRMDFERQADGRLAAVMLALRLYALDHGGARPAALAELTPRYLPGVPGDPMTAGGRPLRYVPTGERPRVYSVGDDGVDDGGSEERRPGVLASDDPERPLGRRWQAKDAVVPLARPTRYFPWLSIMSPREPPAGRPVRNRNI
jgi:hypothetical protein